MARTDQPHKLTFDAFVAKCAALDDPLNEKHKALDYSRPETRAAWNGSKSKIPIWCTVHSEFFVQQAANHMNGQGCPNCGKDVFKAKRRKADPVADFERVHGTLYDYSRVAYVNVHTPVEIGCYAHGPFWQKPNAHLTGDGCPACWENRRKAFGAQRTVDFKTDFAERAARIHGGVYAILKAPEHAHDTVRLFCPTHGEFEQKAFSHLAGHGCWSCGQATNHTQLEVAAFIESLGVKIDHENRAVLGGLHIDIWAPDLKIGVEYHGSYWHTEARVGNKHREKWERAQAAGVRLIQLFDFEWLEHREAAENRLQALFASEPVLGARECTLDPNLESLQAHRFLTRFHTQSAAPGRAAAYGLWHADELVAVMTFALDRFKGSGWELLRYASKGRVQGGFSRLLKAFLKDRAPDRLVSYCDLRWGDGRVYKQAGFTLDAITPPDYWYTDKRGHGRISRYSPKIRKRLEGVSESERAAQQGYQRVCGVGHQRWVLRP